MSVHNSIVLTADPKGKFMEGFISGTPKPGTVVQFKSGVAAQGGRRTFEVYNRDADGDRPKGPLWVLLNNYFTGKGPTDAYVDGERCWLYCPLPGDELKLLLKNIAGTGDSFAFGDILMVDDGTGLLIDTTGTPETEPFMLMEDVAAITADTLAHVIFSGF